MRRAFPKNAGRSVGTALWLERTAIEIALAGSVDARSVLGDARARRGIVAMELHQVLTGRAGVAVLLGVEHEVGTRQGAVPAIGLIEHRDVLCDAPPLDQEGQVLSGAIGAVGNQALRLQPDALRGTVEHRARGADLGLADGAARLDIEDDRVLGIDQLVGGIGEEGQGPDFAEVAARDLVTLVRGMVAANQRAATLQLRPNISSYDGPLLRCYAASEHPPGRRCRAARYPILRGCSRAARRTRRQSCRGYAEMEVACAHRDAKDHTDLS